MSKREKLTSCHILMSQWDFKKNQLDPTQLTVGSGKKAWWFCDKGHSWEAMINNRYKGNGCPYCGRQKLLVGFNDLQTCNPSLAKEWNYEKNKFPPSQIISGSSQTVWWICNKRHSWKATIHNRIAGTGCPYCAGRKVFAGFNDLQTCNPALAKEWDYEKNKLTPSQVTWGSSKPAWWICDKGHSWEAPIASRNRGSGCPYCSGRLLLIGFNDLQTRRPDLIKEWDYEKNELPPSQYMAGANKVVWWKCVRDHSWEARINDRNRGNGCIYCSGNKVLPGFNDLKTLNPILANEWDYENNSLTPSQVTLASNKYVWWKCFKGHLWKATVASRSINGNGCSVCAGRTVLVGFNDLETFDAELASEWDYRKNTLSPSQVTAGYTKPVWWKCAKGHSWYTSVANRVSKGTKCPYCYGRIPYNPRCVKL